MRGGRPSASHWKALVVSLLHLLASRGAFPPATHLPVPGQTPVTLEEAFPGRTTGPSLGPWHRAHPTSQLIILHPDVLDVFAGLTLAQNGASGSRGQAFPLFTIPDPGPCLGHPICLKGFAAVASIVSEPHVGSHTYSSCYCTVQAIINDSLSWTARFHI